MCSIPAITTSEQRAQDFGIQGKIKVFKQIPGGGIEICSYKSICCRYS